LNIEEKKLQLVMQENNYQRIQDQ